jgi:cell division protein FtsB
MTGKKKRPAIGAMIYFAMAFTAGIYFTFAAVQGDYGIFRRVQVDAEARDLRAERDSLQARLDVLKNKTRRLSDGYLDLDLLGEQARDVMGYMRPDEIAIR